MNPSPKNQYTNNKIICLYLRIYAFIFGGNKYKDDITFYVISKMIKSWENGISTSLYVNIFLHNHLYDFVDDQLSSNFYCPPQIRLWVHIVYQMTCQNSFGYNKIKIK